MLAGPALAVQWLQRMRVDGNNQTQCAAGLPIRKLPMDQPSNMMQLGANVMSSEFHIKDTHIHTSSLRRASWAAAALRLDAVARTQRLVLANGACKVPQLKPIPGIARLVRAEFRKGEAAEVHDVNGSAIGRLRCNC